MRSIQSVFDADLNRHLSANEFFERASWKVNAFRRKETSRYQQGVPAYLCSLCDGAVYARKGGFNGTDHFAHRKGEDNNCSWHTRAGRNLKQINAGKFEGRQESKLHYDLKMFIANSLERDAEFNDIRVEKSAVSGDRHSTRPDVFAYYGERKLAFELQLSTTQVPIIEKRESYNQGHDIITIWVFHDFTKFREMTTSQDIYVANFFNAFELDGESIAKTKNTGDLHFKVWWRTPEAGTPRDNQVWQSDLVSIHELKWHDMAKKAYSFDYLREEVKVMRAGHPDFVDNFEPCWLGRKEKGGAWERSVELKAYDRLSESLNDLWDVPWDTVQESKFYGLLDRLLEIREGRTIFGNQNLKGRVDTVLETWPWFTDALVAVVQAYECTEVLEWSIFWQKVQRNRECEMMGEPKFRQKHAFNPALRFLFPEAAVALYQDI